ncbi:hypothetical protein IFM89_015104 [Coptis chinensis]|uniref:Uncharacterized protein n=1 Tax=Coptis chinensis TaxID=261450 RepID=A0A835ISJ4_9MAGN|nr:hypothetical protein IFM89_015104 [Coptis chinensis]
MSIIVGCPDKTVKIFVKGADASMFNVINKSINSFVASSIASHLHTYSSLGLRTLVVAMRELNSLDFEQWQSIGIEDKLQQGVPEAIESLRQAGIKVRVLTGDKQETAISVGYSSKLLTGEMTQILISSESTESYKKSLHAAQAMSKKLVTTSAGIVALVKNNTDDMTLAIGDGANDVSMIQVANVGVGITGQEGRRAVMASDFAMGSDSWFPFCWSTGIGITTVWDTCY